RLSMMLESDRSEPPPHIDKRFQYSNVLFEYSEFALGFMRVSRNLKAFFCAGLTQGLRRGSEQGFSQLPTALLWGFRNDRGIPSASDIGSIVSGGGMGQC